MLVKVLLAAWTLAGMGWWIISWCLVVAANRQTKPHVKKSAPRFLTIFKPLPPLERRGLTLESRGLESFIAQLDEHSELLLGVHESDWPVVMPFVQRMQAAYPDAQIHVVRRSEADSVANPKIAWQRLLAPHAHGDLWLWSDADIVAAPHFLEQARSEFENCGAEMLTFPYAVRSIPHPPALLDALFVNTEFYPGVLLLRRFGPVDFGLGAAMLFSRESFQARIDWNRLGSGLADDFMLGQALQPVRLSSTTLETVADATDWISAFRHYLRWKKTVCWCRPGGFAAQILIMPLLGWMLVALWTPAQPWVWMGLIGIIQADVLFATLICRKIGCRLSFHDLLATEAWSVWRVLFWIVCWFPGRVHWGTKAWRQIEQPA